MAPPPVELVVIGASAGGVKALRDVLSGLPEQLPITIVIVVHTPGERHSHLPEVLARHSRLPVAFAASGVRLDRGHIYVAPPDVHVLIHGRAMRLSRGPREKRFRPAIDPLFRTAARYYGARVMGVILSGALDDGTLGLKLLKEAGGVTVVQDPYEADVPSMPLNALRHVDVDHTLPAKEIGALISASQAARVESAP